MGEILNNEQLSARLLALEQRVEQLERMVLGPVEPLKKAKAAKTATKGKR